MRTIQTKLFVQYTIFTVAFVLFGILLNSLFLEQYYVYKNKPDFLEASKKMLELHQNNRNSLTEFIRMLDQTEGIGTTIADNRMNILMAFPPRPDPRQQRLPMEVAQMIRQNEAHLNNSYVYSVLERQGFRERDIIFVMKLDSKEMLVLRKPMKGISASAAIANQFNAMAGALVICIGGIFIFLFSRKITRPVIEMSRVAEGISKLDFSQRVKCESQDELGKLGNSINAISEKLSASLNELRQDVERRKQLVRNLSHELKTPIGVVKGYAEGLKFGVAEDKEKTERYCTVIADECDRMDRMVRELLTLSQLESGSFQINASRFDLAEMLRRMTERFEPALAEKAITLELSCAQLNIFADKELLERAVNNYLINAIDHADGAKIIKVTGERRETAIRLSVYNSGKQIPVEDLDHIWDVFYKVDKARSRQYGGHGIGLSIVYLIAQIHGGTTGVENINNGVCFFVEIPERPESIV
jgi:signal transduction histidine kinase